MAKTDTVNNYNIASSGWVSALANSPASHIATKEKELENSYLDTLRNAYNEMSASNTIFQNNYNTALQNASYVLRNAKKQAKDEYSSTVAQANAEKNAGEQYADSSKQKANKFIPLQMSSAGLVNSGAKNYYLQQARERIEAMKNSIASSYANTVNKATSTYNSALSSAQTSYNNAKNSASNTYTNAFAPVQSKFVSAVNEANDAFYNQTGRESTYLKKLKELTATK